MQKKSFYVFWSFLLYVQLNSYTQMTDVESFAASHVAFKQKTHPWPLLLH